MSRFFRRLFGDASEDELDKQRIAELAAEIARQFASDFQLYFRDCVIQREKDRYMTSLDPEEQLFRSLARVHGQEQASSSDKTNPAASNADSNASEDSLEGDESPLSPYTLATVIRGIGGTGGTIPIYDLFPAPLPAHPVKQGLLVKLGSRVRNWKTRFFVAGNRAENFVVRYYEDASLSRLKGSFNCCGYTVHAFSEAENEHFGDFGIKLVHPDEHKRVWMFRAESEEEQNAWIQVFNTACQKSTADPLRDPLFSLAFQRALRSTRSAYGLFGTLTDALTGRTETEALTQSIKQVITREVVEEFIQTSAALKKNPEQCLPRLRESIHALIYPIAAQCWSKELLAAESALPSWESAVRVCIEEILHRERLFESALGDALKSLVDPILLELQTTVCEPVLRVALDGVLRSYELAYVSLGSALWDLSEHLHSSESVLEAVSTLQGDLDSPQGFLCTAYTELWQAFTEDLVQLENVFSASGLSAFYVYGCVYEDLQSVAHNALYTLQELVAEEYQQVSVSERVSVTLCVDEEASPLTTHAQSQHTSEDRTPHSSKDETSPLLTQPRPHSLTHTLSQTELAEQARMRWQRVSRANQASRVCRTLNRRRRQSGGSLSHAHTPTADSGAHTQAAPALTARELRVLWDVLLQRLEHDIGSAIESRLQTILLDAMETSVQEMALAPALDLVENTHSLALTQTQTQTPTGAQRGETFLQPQCVCERMVRGLVTAFTYALLRRHCEEARMLIGKWRAQLPCSPPAEYD